MSNRFQFRAANLLMVLGVIPFATTLCWVGMSWNYRGAAALSAVFIIVYLYTFAYVVALAIGFPASIWSYWLSKTTGLDSRWASRLRACVMIVMLTPFAICAVIAFRIALR
jgi:hypothetical protein